MSLLFKESHTNSVLSNPGRVPKVTVPPTGLGKGSQGLEFRQAALQGALGEGAHVDRSAVQEGVDASGWQGRREKEREGEGRREKEREGERLEVTLV